MKIDFSAEFTEDVTHQYKYVNIINESLKTYFLYKDYGKELIIYIDIIAVKDEFLNYFTEGFTQKIKPKSLIIKIQTDYNAFKKADEKEAYLLIHEVIIKAVKRIKETDIKGFDIDKFESDIKDWWVLFKGGSVR